MRIKKATLIGAARAMYKNCSDPQDGMDYERLPPITKSAYERLARAAIEYYALATEPRP